MVEELENDATPGELVDNVVGRPIQRYVQELLQVRRCLLDRNEKFLEIGRDIRGLRLRRAILGRSIVELEQQRQGNVWVPPSSCGGTSTHQTIREKMHRGAINCDGVEKFKAEYRVFSRELRGLALKKAFLVWRMKSVLYREMEAMMTSVEKYANVDLVRDAFKCWKEAADPWFYDTMVLEQMDIFRRVSELGQVDRMLLLWRESTQRSKDLQIREGILVQERDKRLLKDALAQWKVYRVTHHLDVMRWHMAATYNSLYVRKKVLLYWIHKARRRLLLQGRMGRSVLKSLVQKTSGQQLTVDDLLLLGDPVSSNDFTVLRNIRKDVGYLKHASEQMRPRVRWNNLEGVVYERRTPVVEYEPSKYVDDDAMGEVRLLQLYDDIQNHQSVIGQLREERELVRHDIEALSRDAPRYVQRHNDALQKLAEYESAMSDLETVKNKFEIQLRKLMDVAQMREAEYLDKAAHVQQLEEVHHATSDALQKAKADVLLHSKSIEKTENNIREWKVKIRQHSRAAMSAKKTECSAPVKLQESRDRLHKSEKRLAKLIESLQDVRSAQSDASMAEKVARIDLEKAVEARDTASESFEKARGMVENLHSQIIALDRDYDSIMPHLDRCVKRVEEASIDIKRNVDTMSGLKAKCLSIERDIETQQSSLENLKSECRRLSFQDKAQMNTNNDSNDQEVETTSCVYTFSGTKRYAIPGERMLLESARSYAILKQAMSCLLKWRSHTGAIRSIVKDSYCMYMSQYVPRAFLSWRNTVMAEQQYVQGILRMRIISSGFKAWKQRVDSTKRRTYLVQSYKAMKCVCLKQLALRSWRDVLFVEKVGSDAACRIQNQKMCTLFHFWRDDTSKNLDLRCRYQAYRETQDVRIMQSVLDTWKLTTERCRLLSRVFDLACQAWSARLLEESYYADTQRILRDCMSFWSIHVHVTREKKRLERICIRIQDQKQGRMLGLIMEQWRATTCDSVMSRMSILDSITSRNQRNTLLHCFRCLQSSSRDRIRKTAALRVAWTCDHPRRFILKAWMHAVQRTRHKEMIDDRCLKLRYALNRAKDNGQIQAIRGHPALHTIASSKSPLKRIQVADCATSSPDQSITAISV